MQKVFIRFRRDEAIAFFDATRRADFSRRDGTDELHSDEADDGTDDDGTDD